MVRSTLVIGNIHCPSCVSTIESILSSYSEANLTSRQAESGSLTSFDQVVGSLTQSRSKHSAAAAAAAAATTASSALGDIELSKPAFSDVAVSIVDRTVSFSHAAECNLKPIIAELREAGFEVSTFDASSSFIDRHNVGGGSNSSSEAVYLHPPSSTHASSRWSRFADALAGGGGPGSRRRRRAHRDVCVACQREEAQEKQAGYDGSVLNSEKRPSSGIQQRQGDAVSKAVGGGGDVVELVLAVEGMTCSSCTSAIENALAPHRCSGIISVKITLLNSTATIIYDAKKTSEREIVDATEALGYTATVVTRRIVDKPASTGSVFHDDSQASRSNEGQYRVTLSIEGMTCAACTSAVSNGVAGLGDVQNFQVDLMSGSATFTTASKELAEKVRVEIEDLGYDCQILSLDSVQQAHPDSAPRASQAYRADFSIGGMTCASCVGSITNGLSGMDGVSGLRIDLMGHSGSATVAEEGVAGRIRSEIEDLGYECEIVKITTIASAATNEDLKTGNAESNVEGLRKARTVNIRIDGFFCDHCPAKANRVLEDLARKFDMTFTPSTLSRPVSSLTYVPNPPAFTLRTIRHAITKLSFTLTVVQPDTLQDRARRAQRRERKRLLLRLLVAALFCMPTFIFGVVGPSLLSRENGFRIWLEEPIWGSARRFTIALFVLATPVQFGVGSFYYMRAYKSMRGVWRKRRGNADQRKVWVDRLLRWGSMDSLVALGTSIAWASSLAYMILDITKPGMSSEMGYFDTSVFLITFILAGRYLESISRQKTGDALLELSRLKPKQGVLYNDQSNVEEVEAPFIEIGDRLLVPVGASSPVDGKLSDQSSLTAFDEASLTGESRPVAKKVGDAIYAGTINAGPAAAMVEVVHGDGETVIDSITIGVRNAMAKKASIERLADSITAIFVPIIVGIACLTFLIWIMRGYTGDLPGSWLDDQKEGGWALFAFQFSVAVLVVACPCGIGLAAPTAQLVGVGLAARHGIMPNGGGEAFQSFSNVDAIIFDKTGTLTLGHFQVAATKTIGGCPLRLLWTGLAAIEQASTHPIALAVHAHAKAKLEQTMSDGLAELPVQAEEINEIPGKGMTARLVFEGKPSVMAVGNAKLMQDMAANLHDDIVGQLREWQEKGMSTVIVSCRFDGSNSMEVAAIIAAVDPIRPEAPLVLQELERQGVATYIVSGDVEQTVQAVAKELHIPRENIVGSASPEDKKDFIEQLQATASEIHQRSSRSKILSLFWRKRTTARRKLVAMVGDGVNDSIALTQANVSIAQGGGSQVATSTADFALLNDSLLSILTLQAISRSTYRTIISNFVWACIYNIVLIPISAGAFYDLGQTKLPAVWASLAMALSSVSVVVNSLLLRWTFRLPKAVQRYRNTQA